MTQTVTPTFSGIQDVVAKATLTRGSTARGTIDLRGAFGAKLWVRIGRTGTAALDQPVKVKIRALQETDTAGKGNPAPYQLLESDLTAAGANTTIAADAAAGASTITVASATGIAADDVLCIQDAGGGFTRLEFRRVSKISGTTVTLDSPLEYAHTAAQADTVRDLANCWGPVFLPGGEVFEIIFDYGAATTGDSVTIHATANVHESDTIT